jgi:DNA-nicking Smr family endonuclease
MHGKVIGKGAATKKDIESDYGVTLTFPPRDDADNGDIIVEGSASSCENAKARILDICGLSNNADVEDARNRVNALRARKDELFRRAYDAPRGPERDDLFRQANALKDQVEAAEDEAALHIFRVKNRGYGDDQMDLHGLTVEAAEKFVNQRLDKVAPYFSRNEGFVLSIITGIGNHSENHVAKIKPAIWELLRKRGFSHQMDDTGGIILVTGLEGSGVPTHAFTPNQPQGGPTTNSGAPRPQQQQPGQEGLDAFFANLFELIACCFGGGNSSKRRSDL